jgi:mannose-6-phosphate isomerase-like protein (cupin superfamily)
MIETPQGTLWSFPAGWLMHERDVKGYAVETTDGHVGGVAWASYEPGESYLVVSDHHGLDEAYYVLPAGAVELVDHELEVVELKVGIAEVRHFFPPYTDA